MLTARPLRNLQSNLQGNLQGDLQGDRQSKPLRHTSFQALPNVPEELMQSDLQGKRKRDNESENFQLLPHANSRVHDKCDFRGPDANIPLVFAPTQIWIYCLDSHNAMRAGPCDNPTNDTVLQVQMTADRQIFTSMELVTAEIPLSEYLDIDFRLQKDLILPLCEEDRTLERIDGARFVLPPTWNRVDYDDGVFRTEVAHQLDSAPGTMWLWGDCEPVALVHDGELCHDVHVLGGHTFRLERAHGHKHALYIWSTPLTFGQISYWMDVPFDKKCLRFPGFIGTPLYNRLTSCDCAQMCCEVPCVRLRATTANFVEQLQIRSNACLLPQKSSVTITDYCGKELSALTLPAGYFNPDVLCKELSKGCIEVSIDCGRLRIHHCRHEMFRVKFEGLSADGTYFGFAFSELEGRSSYEADKSECWCLPHLEWSAVECNKIAVRRVPVTAKGTIHGDRIKFEDAHCFRVDDAVIVRIEGESALTRVVGKKLHSIEVDRPHGWEKHQTLACSVESFPAPLFFLSGDCDQIFGHLVPAGNGGWVSAEQTYLGGPSYILVQIVDPMGSAQCEQVSMRGNVSGIIGKLVFVSLFKTLYEHVPRIFRFFPARRVTEIHVRLLNPDGSLYNLNGMHWSATLLFRT